MYEVVLSHLAAKKLDALLDYLATEWFVKVSSDFFRKFDAKLNHVASFPESCVRSGAFADLHLCVVTKQTSFLYRINNNIIEVITVFDNRMTFASVTAEVKRYYRKL